MMDRPKRLNLVKGREHYSFSYYPGREAEVIRSFVALANDPDCAFDWLDAAVLSFQLERRKGRLEAPVRSS
jgi:hypothetical protein